MVGNDDVWSKKLTEDLMGPGVSWVEMIEAKGYG
jgi:hypothetical protein